MSNGVVFYHGPSRIDGKPIVGIATGLQRASANPKTGNMVQTWILRADVSPLDAAKFGEDVSICGGCQHRPVNSGTCYVSLFQGPRAVWATFRNGDYPVVTPRQASRLFAGRKVRLGAYGDPVAVPVGVWREIVKHAAGHTGYTHQWRSERLAGAFRDLCQASVDSIPEWRAAVAKGWGTYRVRSDVEPTLASELVCPASTEGNHSTTCERCLMCDGTSQHQIVIIAHGARAHHFRKEPTP
jgi:hypothetical protein